MICGLSCGFADRGSGRLLDCQAPGLTVVDLCIWHRCGTNLSRRQSATTTGAPTDRHAYVSVYPHRPQPHFRGCRQPQQVATGHP